MEDKNALLNNETIDEMSERWEKEMEVAGVPNEEAMRKMKGFWPKTAIELANYINSLVDRPHSYGTMPYAMALAAVAAFNYVAHKCGVTGFQASFADLEILRHTRSLEVGVVHDYNNLLYPQYADKFQTISKSTWTWLQAEAKKKLVEKHDRIPVHDKVMLHWQSIVDGKVPFGLRVA